MKREAYERQSGKCIARNAVCNNKKFDISQMEADHITPWKEGGQTAASNCQMICREDNRRKGSN
jgi:5-methylcytosine-specific restriction endonuclease McrA